MIWLSLDPADTLFNVLFAMNCLTRGRFAAECGIIGLSRRMAMNAKANALTFLGLGLALAGCASFEDELPESCVVIEEVKTTPPNKVVIDTKMEVRSYPVISTFLERMSSASEDIKGFGASTVKSEVIAKESDEEREWKEFFARCSGVTWPVGDRKSVV